MVDGKRPCSFCDLPINPKGWHEKSNHQTCSPAHQQLAHDVANSKPDETAKTAWAETLAEKENGWSFRDGVC